MILGSLLLKREETAVYGFVRRSFFIKMGYRGVRRRPGIPKKKNHSAGYAHSARGGHLNLSVQPKRPLHKIMCSGLLLSCYVRCALKSGGSGGSSLRGSSLGRCSLGRCSLGRCSLRGSSLAGSSLRRSSLGNSGACGSSLRGRSSGRSRATASGHASSQSQSNNSDANILEFHINDLLSLLVNVWQRAFGSTSLRCYILIRF